MLTALFEPLLQDARFGLRMFVRTPGATAVCILALAMGIGINTAAFTAYKAMLLRPVDAVNASEIRNVAVLRESGKADYFFSYPDFETFRQYTRGGFSDMVVWHPERVTFTLPGTLPGSLEAAPPSAGGLLSAGSANAEFAQVFVVSPNYFSVLGIARSFPHDHSAIIGDSFWTRRFGRDPNIAGRTVMLNNIPVVIAGVAPAGFTGTGISEPAFWVPATLDPRLEGQPELLVNREAARYRVFGRLATTDRAVEAQLDAAIRESRSLHKQGTVAATGKATPLIWTGSPFPLPMHLYPGLGMSVLLILGATGMVLVVACANVGSLQLARVRARYAELRLRAWLGATRQRVMRQFATEYAMLGLAAGILAHAVAYIALRILVWWSGLLLPVGYGALIFDVTPDATVLLFVAALSVGGGLLAGIAPSFLAGKAGLGTHDGRRSQNLLVAGQVALSMILLATAGMLVRTSAKALHVDPGFAAPNLMTVDIQFRKSARVPPERQQALLRRLRAEIEALPGVRSVTADPAPGTFPPTSIRLPGNAATFPIQAAPVSDGYFDMTGIPLLYGRGTAATDSPEGLVLNETAVRRIWPEAPVWEAIGRQVQLSGERNNTRRTFTVIGVARDTANLQVGEADALEAYLPVEAGAALQPFLLIRTSAPASQMVQPVTALMRESKMQSEGLLTITTTLEENIRQSSLVVLSGIAAAIASSVGLLGLILALMGIAGTVAYIVALRTREIGIRMAIGAQTTDVISLACGREQVPLCGVCWWVRSEPWARYTASGPLFMERAVSIGPRWSPYPYCSLLWQRRQHSVPYAGHSR